MKDSFAIADNTQLAIPTPELPDNVKEYLHKEQEEVIFQDTINFPRRPAVMSDSFRGLATAYG